MSKRRRITLCAALVLLGVGWTAPAGAFGDQVGPGCEPDRRTEIYSGTTVSSRSGTWMPCVVDTGMTSGESGLAIDSAGTLFRSVATNPTGIAVSSDNGATWHRQLLPDNTPTAIADGYIDPTTNRYFYTGFGSDSKMYYTDDAGKTWNTGTFDSALRQDWPKIFSGRPVEHRDSGYRSNIDYCDWTVPIGIVNNTLRCYRSTNGGQNFNQVGADIIPPPCSDPGQLASIEHGRGIVDGRNGTIYLPFSSCGRLYVLRSDDEGASWTRTAVPQARTTGVLAVLDGLRSRAYQQQLLSGNLNPVNAEMSASENSDALAMTATGRLYIVWVDGQDYLPYLASSTDGGMTWSQRILISPPSVTQAVLPSLTISPRGQVGLSYYGTTDKTTWTGYLTVIGDAETPAPTLQTASVTEPGKPLMTEPCCWANGPQEYTAARWAPDGSLWAAFAGSRPAGDAEGMLGRIVPLPQQ